MVSFGFPKTETAVSGNALHLSETAAAEEVRMVVDNITRHHPNPFHVTPKEQFYGVVDELLARNGEISTAAHFFGLTRLASLIFDTHTQLHVTHETPGFKASYPLRFRIFPDGLYIIAGSDGYQAAIGKKVLSISGRKPDAVLDSLSQHASSDNLPRKRVFAEQFLYMPETYDVFGLRTENDDIALVLEDGQGQQSTLLLSETWQKGYADFSWDRLNPFVPKELQTVHTLLGTAVPLYLQRLNDNYWFQFLDDDCQQMYLQINQQFEEVAKSSIEFHLEWSRALWDSRAAIVIIDLRNAPGGMTNVGSGLPKFLESLLFLRSEMNGVVVLMGHDTVSAATILIAELENAVWPLMIGQPTGSSPNMYLNAHKLVLPHSKLQLEVSTTAFVSIHDGDPRAYIAPDIPMALAFEDYQNGRDPLLETAKTVDRQLMASTYERAGYRTPWLRRSQQKAVRL